MEIMSLQAVDVNERFLSETNNLDERPCVNPWQKRQSEGLVNGWRFDQKILLDRGQTGTLQLAMGTVPVREAIFQGGRDKQLLVTCHLTYTPG